MVSLEQMKAWEEQAKADGVQLVVGALVVRDGKIFVQQRSFDRKLFPGCWDIVGGHVEDGEGLYDALVRETMEESGWKITKVVALAMMFEWPKGDETMREYDFIVEVEGDAEPVLEEGKVTGGMWAGPEDTDKLVDNRDAGDDNTRRVVEAALAMLNA